MKKTVVFATLLFAITSHSALAYQNSDLVGTWQCTSNDAKTGMTMQSTDTYSKDGTSIAVGVFSLNLPMMGQPITVNMTSKGSWQLRGSTIVGKLIDAQASSPQFPQLASLFKQQLQKNMTANSQIVSLTNNKMTLRSSSQNMTVTCHR